MFRTHQQPLGHVTRGKTAPYRLRRVDRFVTTAMEPLLRRWEGWEDAAFVDLGYGRVPTTTLESAQRFRTLCPSLLVIGIEIEPERVARGMAVADARTRFRRGGFELPLEPHESVRLIRALNVLRQYPPEAVDAAHRDLMRQLRPGGVLIEGTSTPTGHHMVLNVLGPDRRPLVLFSVNPRQIPSHPSVLQAVLPKNYIHRMVPGEPIHGFMEAWDRAWRTSAHAATFGPLCHWAEAGRVMMERPDVVRRPAWLRRGWLMWRPDVG